MRTQRRLSIRQFERRNPSLYVASVSDKHIGNLEELGPEGLTWQHFDPKRRPKRATFETKVLARKHGSVEDYAVGKGRNLDEALYDLGERCLKLAGLEALDRQGWKDANSGATGVPLQVHHLKKRSTGRSDSPENLAGVTGETHGYQHERKPQ